MDKGEQCWTFPALRYPDVVQVQGNPANGRERMAPAEERRLEGERSVEMSGGRRGPGDNAAHPVTFPSLSLGQTSTGRHPSEAPHAAAWGRTKRHSG